MTNSLILVSSCEDRLASWMRGLDNFDSTTFTIDRLLASRLDVLRDDIARIKPQVLLLDFDLLGLDRSNSISALRRLCVDAKTIIMSGDISEDMEWELLKAGIRGCCPNDAKPEFLKQVVEAVQDGELWIRRTLTSRLIDELGKTTAKNKAYRATLGLLNTLTQREYDIAVRVGNGESNKQIAQECAITERTVKAHLTEIFLKLGVADRLNLALILSADNRNALANAENPFNGGNSESGPLGGSRVDDNNA